MLISVLKYLTISISFAILAGVSSPVPISRNPFEPGLAQSDIVFLATLGKAAIDPAVFEGDYFLSDPLNYSYAHPLFVFVTSFMGRMMADYLGPYYALSNFVSLIQALGFFLLGRLLFGRLVSGFLLGISSFAICSWPGLGSWEPMGFMPRGLFNALLPYLLCGAWFWRRSPCGWIGMLAACGILMYIYPIAATIWTPALVLWFLVMGVRKGVRSLKWLAIGVLACGAIALGFFSIFNRAARPNATLQPSEYAQYLDDRLLREPSSSFHASQVALGLITGEPSRSPSKVMRLGRRWILERALRRGPLPLFFLGVMAFISGLRRLETRALSQYFGILGVGIFLGSIVAPFMIEVVESKLGLIPRYFNLLRGVGYFFVPILCLGFIAMLRIAIAVCRLTRQNIPFGKLAVWLQGMLTIIWLLLFPPHALAGAWAKDTPEELEAAQHLQRVLMYIREETPKGTVFVGYQASRYLPWPPDDLAIFVRYHAERPVAFAWKDGGQLLLQNPKLYLDWARKYREAREAISKPWGDENDMKAFCGYARSWGAQMWLVRTDILDHSLGETRAEKPWIKFRNDSYALVDLVAYEQSL